MREEFNTDIVAARTWYEEEQTLLDSAIDLGMDPRPYLRREREAAQNLITTVSNWHKVRRARAIREINNAVSDAYLGMGVDFRAERVEKEQRS